MPPARFRPEHQCRRLVRALRVHAEESSDESLRAYLGSPVPVLGVRVPALRQVARAERGWFRALSIAHQRSMLRALWGGRWFEERLLAIEWLGEYGQVDDAGGWRLADRWVDQATGWALSDSLASGPVSRRVVARPERFSDLIAWTSSPNIWRRRAATYALREWVVANKLARPFRLLRRLRGDPEFWVQRAVGTWLRECWKRDRPATERFLRRHARAMFPTTITVATERAPRWFRTELRALQRARR